LPVKEKEAVVSTPQAKSTSTIVRELGIPITPAVEFLDNLTNNSTMIPNADGVMETALKSKAFKLLVNHAIKNNTVAEAIENLAELKTIYNSEGLNNTPVTDFLTQLIDALSNPVTETVAPIETILAEVETPTVTEPVVVEELVDLAEQKRLEKNRKAREKRAAAKLAKEQAQTELQFPVEDTVQEQPTVQEVEAVSTIEEQKTPVIVTTHIPEPVAAFS